MIIAIDGNEANVKQRVGVNQFAFELLSEIYQLRSEGINFLIFLAEPPLKDMPPETNWWKYEVFGPKVLWTWTGLVKRLFLGHPKPDVLFTPSHYGPGFSSIPFVISIMDLGFLRWPKQFTKKDYFQLKYWTKWSARRAAKIITISQFSKKDIIKTYQIKPEKVVISYPGYKEIKNKNLKPKILKDKYGITKDYLLYLGTLKPSKNIKGLIKAYHILRSQYPNIQLVIAGKKGWIYKDIFALVEKLKLKDRVVFTGFVSDKEKEILLASAKAFVLPSFWEGFGIPVLEAMAVGTPVICSRVASLPEVAAKAAIYIDNPNSIDSIYQAMLKMVKLEDKERKDLIKAGLEQSSKFSWQKTANQTLEVLKEIGG